MVHPDAGLQVKGLDPERVQLVVGVASVDLVTLQLGLELLWLKVETFIKGRIRATISFKSY